MVGGLRERGGAGGGAEGCWAGCATAPPRCALPAVPQAARAPTLQPLCVIFIHLHSTHRGRCPGSRHYCSGSASLLRTLRSSLARSPVPQQPPLGRVLPLSAPRPPRGASLLRPQSSPGFPPDSPIPGL